MPETPEPVIKMLRRKHKEENPECPYGDEPHFIPPSFGQVGFYACMPPEDLTNHTRCRPPYDHEHADHPPLPPSLSGK